MLYDPVLISFKTLLLLFNCIRLIYTTSFSLFITLFPRVRLLLLLNWPTLALEWKAKGECKVVPMQVIKAYEAKQIYLHALLTWALRGGEWLCSCCGRSISEEMALGTQRVGGWDSVEQRKHFLLLSGIEQKSFGRPKRRFISIPATIPRL
jgi:hypothetical protein